MQDHVQRNAGGGGAIIRLFPRRKGQYGGGMAQRGRAPIVLDLATLERKFSFPQQDAANELGISLTSLKQVCRKVGISRWPYYRHAKKGGGRTRELPRSKEVRADSARATVSGDNEQALGTNNKLESKPSDSSPTPHRRGSSHAILTLCEASAVSANLSLPAKVSEDKVWQGMLHPLPSHMLAQLDDAASGMIGASLFNQLSQQKFAAPHQAPPITLPPFRSVLKWIASAGLESNVRNVRCSQGQH
jgi:predicted DNA-binding transcriptional regulator AlpA